MKYLPEKKQTCFNGLKACFFLCFFSLLLIPAISVFSQPKEKTFLTFAVTLEKSEEVGLDNATAKLFEKGTLISTVTTSRDGIALFKLNPNSEYTIEFSKANYVTKIVSINTKIPSYENQMFEVAFPILLFQPCEGLDYSVLNNPIMKLVYNDLKRDFLPEKNYDNVMVPKLEQLLENNDKCIAEKYNSIVRKADRLFTEKKYIDSRATYSEALAIRPEDEYVIDRIKEIDKILAQQKDSEKTYKEYIAQADKQFNAKNYPLAKEFYKRALSLKPSEQYPTSQIAAIDALLAQKDKDEKDKKAQQEQLATQEQARLAQVAKADQARKDSLAKADQDKKAKQAKDEQERQAQLAKAEQERQAQLAKSEQERKALLALQAKAEQQKKDSLARKEQEKKALLAKEEQERKDRKNRYLTLIDQGDESFEIDVCGKALQYYRDALVEKPNDPTVLKKISEAESKCKDLQAKAAKDKSFREMYNKTISDADKLLAAKDYSGAKNNYQKASQLLPTEGYPIDKIKEIDNILKALEKEEQAQYKKLMYDANKAFDNENFVAAKDLFNQILKLRANDQYSKDKIQTIESILAEQLRLEADKKAKQDQFNKMVADADAAFKKPDYAAARIAYQKALELLPSESYPKQKLAEIENIEKDQAAKLDRDYNTKIQSGDRNFASKNFTQALKDYQDAQKIKPNETYPAQRIDDVNKSLAEQARLTAEQKAKQDAYNAAVAKADNLLKSNQYDQALVAYKEASSYKPDEQYPFTKIDEINKLKKEQQDEDAYKKAIATANSFFDQKKFEQAKSYYAQALQIKANDSYATGQIAKADAEIADQIKKLADIKAREDAYNKTLADADKSFVQKDYEMSKTAYQTALSIFPDRPAPKQKIADIDKILKEKKRNDDYKSVFEEANSLFAATNYDQAKAKYKEAMAIKPEETAPVEKIKDIDRILAQKAADKAKKDQLEKNYNESIKKANDLFDKAQYDAAKKEYEYASSLMPNESYPKQKIAKIAELNKLLAKEAGKPQTQTKDDKSKPGGTIADLAFKNDNEREVYLRDLLVKYPAGITVEVYKENSRVVSRYIIIRENQANEFREVKYNWGGADYSRNGKPITYLYFSNQIRSREGEYFVKTDM